MVEEKPPTTNLSGNGPGEEIVATSPPMSSSGDEMARLRDLLIGKHVRTSDQRINDMQNRLEETERVLTAQLNDLSTGFDDRIREVNEQSRKQEERLRQELRDIRALLDDERLSRSELGKMMVEMGMRLQKDQRPIRSGKKSR